MSEIKTYHVKLKDEDGAIYEYDYNDLKWEVDGSLMIFTYAGISNSGERQMTMIAKFQNCRAILEIGEVEDEG